MLIITMGMGFMRYSIVLIFLILTAKQTAIPTAVFILTIAQPHSSLNVWQPIMGLKRKVMALKYFQRHQSSVHAQQRITGATDSTQDRRQTNFTKTLLVLTMLQIITMWYRRQSRVQRLPMVLRT